MASVLQPWVENLTFMQQSVLISAVRAPDNLAKNHPSKLLMRWYRRCVLYSAFESFKAGVPTAHTDASSPGGGSFTGPIDADATARQYLFLVDEVPHHFHLHLVHAAEIIGYKHPLHDTQKWWWDFYIKAVNDMHLRPETEHELDQRLGGDEATWRMREMFPA